MCNIIIQTDSAKPVTFFPVVSYIELFWLKEKTLLENYPKSLLLFVMFRIRTVALQARIL